MLWIGGRFTARSYCAFFSSASEGGGKVIFSDCFSIHQWGGGTPASGPRSFPRWDGVPLDSRKWIIQKSVEVFTPCRFLDATATSQMYRLLTPFCACDIKTQPQSGNNAHCEQALTDVNCFLLKFSVRWGYKTEQQLLSFIIYLYNCLHVSFVLKHCCDNSVVFLTCFRLVKRTLISSSLGFQSNLDLRSRLPFKPNKELIIVL